jgi:hypothetical protein
MVTEIKKFKTADDKEFDSLAQATAHEHYLELVRHFPHDVHRMRSPESAVYHVLTHLLRQGRILLPAKP